MHALLGSVIQAAEELDARHVGFYALNALRLEKALVFGRANFPRTIRRGWPVLTALSRTIGRTSLGGRRQFATEKQLQSAVS